MGFDVIEPYAAFLRALEPYSVEALNSEPQDRQLAIFLSAIKKAAIDDPYFRVLAHHVADFHSLDELQVRRFSEIASAEQISRVHSLDARRIIASDAMLAYLPKPSDGTRREAAVARSEGILAYAFGVLAQDSDNTNLYSACFSDFEALIPTLDIFGSGEGPYFTSAPVGSARGNILIYGLDLARVAPHRVAEVIQSMEEPRQVYSFCCERSHVHELAQKLPVMLRVGKVGSVTILTKDGSPHDVQIHTMAQEVFENVASDAPLYHLVVEKDQIINISAESVKSSRHLHSIEGAAALSRRDQNGATLGSVHKGRTVAVLVGGEDDLQIVEASGLMKVFNDAKLNVRFEIVSSDRQPEHLRRMCISNRETWDLVIAVAGGVPNLPVVIKSWLPDVPVIGVPIDDEPMLASYSLSTPSRVPIIMTGFGERGARKAARLGLQLLEWKTRICKN